MAGPIPCQRPLIEGRQAGDQKTRGFFFKKKTEATSADNSSISLKSGLGVYACLKAATARQVRGKAKYTVLWSAVGKTHDLRSDL